MFINNEYYTEYINIIETAQVRNIIIYKADEYKELHHILPKSLGGDNNKDNIVSLTAEEHLQCHILLPYFTENIARQRMIYAWNMMSNRNGVPIDYDKYLELKLEYSKVNSKLNKGSNNGMYGKKHTQKSKDKNRESHLGKITSDETKLKLSISGMGREISKETKEKMSKAKKGRVTIFDLTNGKLYQVSREEYQNDDHLVNANSKLRKEYDKTTRN